MHCISNVCTLPVPVHVLLYLDHLHTVHINVMHCMFVEHVRITYCTCNSCEDVTTEVCVYLQSDASQRSCTVKVQQGVHLVRLSISFPSHYPYGAAPSFNFDRNGTTIDLTSQQELNQVVAPCTYMQYRHSFIFVCTVSNRYCACPHTN